jgi:ribose 5-phosphate isomerase B
MDTKRVLIGSDHAGFDCKEAIKAELRELGIPFKDVGAHDGNKPVDYPVYAAKIARAVSIGLYDRGIIVGGAGIGAAVVCNRFAMVRAALCNTIELARFARAHNDANVLVLGSRTTPRDLALQIVREWLATAFEGGRHSRRVQLIDDDVRLNIAFGHLTQVDPRKLAADKIDQKVLDLAGAGLEAIRKVFGKDRRDEDENRLPESCPAKIVSGENEYNALMVNLSEGGAQFHVEESEKVDVREFTLDEQLTLTIKTPFGVTRAKGSPKWADVDAKTFGVEFTEIPDDPKDPLRSLMDSRL